jgi:hypothetical protein
MVATLVFIVSMTGSTSGDGDSLTCTMMMCDDCSLLRMYIMALCIMVTSPLDNSKSRTDKQQESSRVIHNAHNPWVDNIPISLACQHVNEW